MDEVPLVPDDELAGARQSASGQQSVFMRDSTNDELRSFGLTNQDAGGAVGLANQNATVVGLANQGATVVGLANQDATAANQDATAANQDAAVRGTPAGHGLKGEMGGIGLLAKEKRSAHLAGNAICLCYAMIRYDMN